MDHKRVIRSQKRESSGFSPYSPAKALSQKSNKKPGFLERIKGFFPLSGWTKSSRTGEVENSSKIVETDNTTKGNKDKSETFQFPAPDVSSFIATNTTSHDNQALSSFFAKKGNQPLSDIELEGVVSIIRRQSTATPLKQGPMESQTNSGFSTPISDKISTQSRRNTSVGTPDFVPKYHEKSSGKTSTSIKRVYQFSGLPSPYRTRIRVKQIKRYPESPERAFSPLASDGEIKSIADTNRPLSHTASALLSILDGPKEESSKQDNIIQAYSNPYSRSVREGKQLNNKIKKTSVISSFQSSAVTRSRDKTEKPTAVTPSVTITSNIPKAIVPKPNGKEIEKPPLVTEPQNKTVLNDTSSVAKYVFPAVETIESSSLKVTQVSVTKYKEIFVFDI